MTFIWLQYLEKFWQTDAYGEEYFVKSDDKSSIISLY